MPKVIFDKRETELWLLGKSLAKDPNGVHCAEVPYGWTHEEWKHHVSESLYLVAGHMGGFGIDLIGYDGRSLSDWENDLDFTYQPPDENYKPVLMGKMITINDLKDN